jgi:hypothetical protein
MVEHCPTCGKGELRRKRVHREMFGVDLGTYRGEICDTCGETFLSFASLDLVEARGKALGVWGVASKVKVVRPGRSLLVRIPARLARSLNIKGGEQVLVTPDKDGRLVIGLA